MKPQSNLIRNSRAAVVAFSGMALALGLVVTAQADEYNKKTVMTIDRPMQVQDTYLEPGTYVFKLLDSQSDRHIVQIFNERENHLYTTILAIPDYRLVVTSKPVFTMWETPAGSAPALKAWFYPGENWGQQFTYPKNLRIVETAQLRTETAPPIAQPEPAPVPQEQAQVEELQQTEIAQNNPPPAPPAVEDQSNNTAADTTPNTLPKTASPYPLIGFAGLMLFGLGGLLRRAHSA